MARPPANAPRPRALPALREWPPPPEHLNDAERKSWARLGVVAMALGRITAADLEAAAAFAEIDALIQKVKADPEAKFTTLNALLNTRIAHLRALCLTTVSRKGASPVDARGDDEGTGEAARVRRLFG